MLRRKDEGHRTPPVWTPEPPPHSQPWSGWVNHMLIAMGDSISSLHSTIEGMQEELDRREIIIEANRKEREHIWEPLKRHGKWIGLALLYVALSSIATGKFPTLKEFLEIARQAAGG
jgi:hypothetical protein